MTTSASENVKRVNCQNVIFHSSSDWLKIIVKHDYKLYTTLLGCPYCALTIEMALDLLDSGPPERAALGQHSGVFSRL